MLGCRRFGGQRLVHEERGGLADDRPAHGHALALTAGQRGGLAGQVRLEAEHLRRLADPALNLRLGRVPQLQPERQVVRHGHVRVSA